MIRYFVRSRDNPSAPNYGEALAVFRFDGPAGIAEQWGTLEQTWFFNPSVLDATGIGGTTDFVEVSEAEASRLIEREPVYHRSGEEGQVLLTPILRRIVIERGGPGSGNVGHAGRPGQVGGSAPGAGAASEKVGGIQQGRTELGLAGDRQATSARLAEPAAFHSAFQLAMRDNPRSNFVNNYSEEELAGMKALLLSPDGKTGMGVKDHGDGRIEGTALFNRGGPPGAGVALLRRAVAEQGVNYAECLGLPLALLYGAEGFEVTDRFLFDPAQAAEGWNYEADDRPDYFHLRLRGT